MHKTYVFVLCPPYSGSTILWKLLGSSAAASSLPREGQFLPETQHWMRESPWDANYAMPWNEIKPIWDRYWDHSKPFLLEKSPPNLLRVDGIMATFEPVRFLVMVRDPYAHCEGLMRRNGWDAGRAAEFSLRSLHLQRQNRALPNAMAFTYEELSMDTASVARRIEEFLPGIGPLNASGTFVADSIDGRLERPITNLNDRKIANIKPDVMQVLNERVMRQREALQAWGYDVIL